MTRTTAARPVAIWLSVALLSWAAFAGSTGHALAASGNLLIDLQPENGAGVTGVPTAMTVVAVDEAGIPNSNVNVRLYFLSGPNDPGGPGNDPDASCDTNAAGVCSFSYLPAAAGTDVVCAVASGSPSLCDEPVEAAELDDNVDVVRYTIAVGPVPTPTPSPSPDPSPTPSPDPSPDPSPSLDPSPDLSPTPSPSPDPSPTPSPSPDPSPTPSPSPDPSPTPSPNPDPSPTPSPNPDPSPTPSPSPDPSPTPSPDPTPASGTLPAPADPTDEPAPATAPQPDPPVPNEPEQASVPEPPLEPDRSIVATPAVPVTEPASAAGPEPVSEISASLPAAAVSSTVGAGPGGVLAAVVVGVADQVRSTVKPAAAAAIATTFGFPLALTAAVLLFVAVQSRLDGRDPKLRFAPTTNDDVLAFEEEDDL